MIFCSANHYANEQSFDGLLVRFRILDLSDPKNTVIDELTMKAAEPDSARLSEFLGRHDVGRRFSNCGCCRNASRLGSAEAMKATTDITTVAAIHSGWVCSIRVHGDLFV